MNPTFIITGCPKSGNHVVFQACRILGVPAHVRHTPYSHRDPNTRYLFIRRDPRNVLVSWVRWRRRQIMGQNLTTQVPADLLIRAMSSNFYLAANFASNLELFEPWMTAQPNELAGSFVFEDVVRSEAPVVLARVAGACGVPVRRWRDDPLFGAGTTWSGRHSDWKESWTPEVEAAWGQHCGDVLARWRYV